MLGIRLTLTMNNIFCLTWENTLTIMSKKKARASVLF